jgi:hypothetical protein
MDDGRSRNSVCLEGKVPVNPIASVEKSSLNKAVIIIKDMTFFPLLYFCLRTLVKHSQSRGHETSTQGRLRQRVDVACA